MTTPDERAFVFLDRGAIREGILSEFRIGLRLQRNPETGVPFTEDEIARATQRGSRWWREANAIDLMGMAQQSRALWLADQVRPERAASSWLHGFHGPMWGLDDLLPASPGFGHCNASATPGTIFHGSFTVPDPGANTARDPAGLRYQVTGDVTTGGSGVADVALIGIDAGPDTNLVVGTILTWENPPLGAQTSFKVAGADFTGGLPQETDADFQSRLRSRIRHKQGAGNNSQVRGWARDASNAVLDAYVYACAMHAGSTLVCLTQKRGGALGPGKLQASDATLASAIAYLVPPGSSVVPARAFFVITTFTEQRTDFVLRLAMPKGTGAGWTDLVPWPGFTSTTATIGTWTNATHFQMHSDTALPGVSPMTAPVVPALMWWNEPTSRWETLDVLSITSAGGNNYDVVLSSPGKVMTAGDRISPDMARRDTLALACEQYFDSLGPGEVIDLATDTRADRAARFPDPSEEAPARAGSSIQTAVTDALGAALSDSSLNNLSNPNPSLPNDVVLGPLKLTLGQVGVYALT